MNLTSKYDLNQKVYHIRNEPEKKWAVCSACDGKGHVILADKKTRHCPECHGNKGRYDYLPTKHMVLPPLTIGKITISITNIEPDGIFSNIGNFKEGNNKTKIEYMMYETGIGSGTCYDENDLFLTGELAQQECNRLNEGGSG